MTKGQVDSLLVLRSRTNTTMCWNILLPLEGNLRLYSIPRTNDLHTAGHFLDIRSLRDILVDCLGRVPVDFNPSSNRYSDLREANVKVGQNFPNVCTQAFDSVAAVVAAFSLHAHGCNHRLVFEIAQHLLDLRNSSCDLLNDGTGHVSVSFHKCLKRHRDLLSERDLHVAELVRKNVCPHLLLAFYIEPWILFDVLAYLCCRLVDSPQARNKSFHQRVYYLYNLRSDLGKWNHRSRSWSIWSWGDCVRRN